jgi:uncharacterized membrane protein
MTKKIAYTFATLLMLAAAFAAQLSLPATAQTSGQPCRNACRQQYNKCVASATNPGGLNQCKKALSACLDTCR